MLGHDSLLIERPGTPRNIIANLSENPSIEAEFGFVQTEFGLCSLNRLALIAGRLPFHFQGGFLKPFANGIVCDRYAPLGQITYNFRDDRAALCICNHVVAPGESQRKRGRLVDQPELQPGRDTDALDRAAERLREMRGSD